MTTDMFFRPEQHPFGMLEGMGLSRTWECESVLAWILQKCVDKGSFSAVRTTRSHMDLVEAGLLIEIGHHEYALTTKAKGLLYSVYGKG